MSDEHARRRRLLWVTNLPAPYRFPAWDALAQRFDLDIWCLGDTERNRAWPIPEPGSHRFAIRTVPSRAISRGEVRLYLPPLRFPDITAYDAVVIGGWESPYYWRLAVEARRRGISSVVFYESTSNSHRFAAGPVALIRRRFFTGADAVITVGSSSTQAVLAMGLARERVYESFNSVDVARFHDGVAGRRPAQPVDSSGHRYVYVGQLIARKNVASLIQAFALIREPGDTLTIVGDGDLRFALEALASSLGLELHVEFTGGLTEDEVIGVYARTDTLVLPSNQEVWGLVVNEALASGLHVVVSNACGVVADIDDMRGVTVVDPTPDSIAAGMRASRDTWVGSILLPEILKVGSESLAVATQSALIDVDRCRRSESTVDQVQPR